MKEPQRSLLIDRLPNVERVSWGANVGSLVSGAAVANVGLVRSLLRYGSYDSYFYIQESPMPHKRALFPRNERLRPIHLGNLESLPNNVNELVLFATSQHLAKFVPVRQLFRRSDWPISALAYGLSLNWLIPQHVWNVFSATGPQDALICTSQCHRRAMEAIDEGILESASIAASRRPGPRYRYHVLPLGVEAETVISGHPSGPLESVAPNTGFVALSIGRLSTTMKVDLRPVIQAFITCERLPAGSLLLIAGDDPSGQVSSSLQSFANEIPGPNQVLVLSEAAGIRKQLIAMADVMVCLSDNMQESFGIVVVEAMLAGLPIVAPAWNGYTELVEDGVTGFLVPTGFMADTQVLSAFAMLIDPAYSLGQRVVIDINAMMSALATLAEKQALRSAFGDEGKRRAFAHFTWEKVLPSYEELWNDQIQRGRLTSRDVVVSSAAYYDFETVFGHYATGHLTTETAIQCAPRSEANRANLSPASIAGFDPAIDKAILDIATRERRTTISALVAQTDRSETGASQVMTQIARLLKYGLLSLCRSADGQDSNTLEYAEPS